MPSSAPRSSTASGPSPSSRPASWLASSQSRRLRVASSRSCSAPPSPSTPGSSASGWSAMTAPASSGWTPRDLLDAAVAAGRSPHLEFLGLHAFGASNVLDAGALLDHIRATVHVARRLALAAGTTLRLVDAGGGLGIPYEPHEESLDLRRLGTGLTQITEAWARDPLLAGARLLLEPGRFLVGPVGRLRRARRRSQDGQRRDGGHPRWRRPSRPAPGPGRPGAPNPVVEWPVGSRRPAQDAAGDRGRTAAAPGWTCSARRP